MRAIFSSAEGTIATSDLLGAPRGGNGDKERGAPEDEPRIEDGEEPQLQKKPGLVGELGKDFVGDRGFGVREMALE